MGVSCIEKINGKHVKDIIFIVGYYWFHADLSRVKNTSELERISKVYNLILHDCHNAIYVPPGEALVYSPVFDIKKIVKLFTEEAIEFLGGYYFTEDKTRLKMRSCYWNDHSKSWVKLSDSIKEYCGKKRVAEHNRLIKYEHTYQENNQIFDELIRKCNEKKINVWIVAAPASKQYMKHLNVNYETSFYNTLDKINGVLNLIDFNDIDAF